MAAHEHSTESSARTYARTAGAAYGEAAAYLRVLSAAEWDGPTGCADWDIRTLAAHIVGEAVWFPNLARGVIHGELPLPQEIYASLKTLSPVDLAGRLQNAADAIAPTIEDASPDQLQQEVDLDGTTMPLWRATYVALSEAVYHTWDLHVGRKPEATIPTAWARTLATGMVAFAPLVAHQDGIAAAPGRYLLHVADGVGPVTVTAEQGRFAVARGRPGRRISRSRSRPTSTCASSRVGSGWNTPWSRVPCGPTASGAACPA